MEVDGKHYRTIWMEGRVVRTINQPLLPHRFEIVDLQSYEETAGAITSMLLRGAGAIGAAGGFGMAQAVLSAPDDGAMEYVDKAAEVLRNTRPTAQDLFYAIDRVWGAVKSLPRGKMNEAAVAEANAIADEYVEAGASIGRLGADLIEDGCRILTHCNAGWLAFVDWGSALAGVYAAKRQGKKVFVYVDETRPRCQGARLTAWELCGEQIPHAIIADNAAGHYMRTGQVDMVIVGSDRIAANGDVANKIGTYEKAVLAKENGIQFYVAAPTSTIDMNCPNGGDIPIEERDDAEVLCMFGKTDGGAMTKVRVAPEGSAARNPAFDVTPARYVTAIITERRMVKPGELRALL